MGVLGRVVGALGQRPGSNLAWGAVFPAVAALIYAVNGLTSPFAEVTVRSVESVGALDPRLVDGSLVGVLRTWEITRWNDRLFTRLTIVVPLVLLSLALASCARHLRQCAHSRSSWRATPTRAARSLGVVLLLSGLLPGMAQWVQGATVLAAIGAPDGLEPVSGLGPGWLVAGTLLLLWTRRSSGGDALRLRTPRSTRVRASS